MLTQLLTILEPVAQLEEAEEESVTIDSSEAMSIRPREMPGDL
jgi:hypothetical protein